MSDYGEEEEEKKVEIKEEPGKKFFLSHVNSYTGRALLKELRNDHLVKEEYAAHTFYATLKKDEEDGSGLKDVAPTGVSKLVTMERTKEFREMVLESDVIIYDLLTNSY